MIIMLVLLLSLAATGRVHGEVPTAVDVAFCNQLAPQAIKTGSASPIMGDHDHTRAERARGQATTTTSTDVTSKAIESSDPQIHGMEGNGAKNAVYQAAYRSCMRRKGF
jgi:hypothetical protein